jgi:hypothetical protein
MAQIRTGVEGDRRVGCLQLALVGRLSIGPLPLVVRDSTAAPPG